MAITTAEGSSYSSLFQPLKHAIPWLLANAQCTRTGELQASDVCYACEAEIKATCRQTMTLRNYDVRKQSWEFHRTQR